MIQFFEDIDAPHFLKYLEDTGWKFHHVTRQTRIFEKDQVVVTNFDYNIHYPIPVEDAIEREKNVTKI